MLSCLGTLHWFVQVNEAFWNWVKHKRANSYPVKQDSEFQHHRDITKQNDRLSSNMFDSLGKYVIQAHTLYYHYLAHYHPLAHTHSLSPCLMHTHPHTHSLLFQSHTPRYLYCSNCIKAAFGISSDRLAHQKSIKRVEANNPITKYNQSWDWGKMPWWLCHNANRCWNFFQTRNPENPPVMVETQSDLPIVETQSDLPPTVKTQNLPTLSKPTLPWLRPRATHLPQVRPRATPSHCETMWDKKVKKTTCLKRTCM